MAGDLIVGYRIFQSGCAGEYLVSRGFITRRSATHWSVSVFQTMVSYLAESLISWDSADKCVVSRASSGPLLLYDIVEHSFQYHSQ